jgi:hypothetical protein
MTEQMPMFDDPIPPAVPAPKKPRRKPTKKHRSAKVAAPKPVKRRKRRVAKIVKTPRLAVMFDACTKVGEALRGLTPKERAAVLESIGHVA